jgi:hypothetical protein
MTRPDRDYDDILSRVLHSTLDPVEPAGDGLAKIQERIAEPWLKRRMSLLRTELAALAWLILVRCEPFLDRARSGIAAIAPGTGRPLGTARPAVGGAAASSGRHQVTAGRHRPGDTGLRRWVGPTMSWLRPTLAVAGAVVLVVAGVFAFGQFRADLFTPVNGSSISNSGSHGQGPKHHGDNGPNGGGESFAGHSGGRQSPSPSATSKAVSNGTRGPSPATPEQSSPAPSPSPSMSPSPSPSSSPTASPTGSPTTSPTSPSGGGTGSPSPATDTG